MLDATRRTAARTGVVKPPVNRLRRCGGELGDGQPLRVRRQPLEAVVDAFGAQLRSLSSGRSSRWLPRLSSRSVAATETSPSSRCVAVICNTHCVYRLMLSNIRANAGSMSRPAAQQRGAGSDPADPQPTRTPPTPPSTSSASASPWSPSCPPGRAASPTCPPSTGRSAAPSPTWPARWPPPGTPRGGSAGSARTASATIWSRRSARTGSTCARVRRDPAPAHRHLLPHRRRPRRRRPRGRSTTAPGPRPPRCHRPPCRTADLWAGRVLHLSGITAALSDDCLALMRDLAGRRPGRPLGLLRRQLPAGAVARRGRAPGPARPGPRRGHRLRRRGRGGGGVGAARTPPPCVQRCPNRTCWW